ncbi:MAG: methyltransferase domain-containing protein [Alphaproteobacteria bacterium]|nr:methyltransferase domain-containing protein [Alphaproteobacteria bacterium]
MAKRPRIFVSIASYRDTECQWTVRDLFLKARHPERVFVGICWQFVKGEDEDCFLFQTRPEQCRVIEVNANESLGACWARSKVQSLWAGEEYSLQIDSHMRFIQDWDEVLLDMLKLCPSKKPILSSYPPGYDPPDQLADPTVVEIIPNEYDAHGVLKLRSNAWAEPKDPPPPKRNPFIAGGLLFGRSSLITDVPYDPYLYFHGEEITLAVRLFTAGYDVYAPSRTIAFHDYTNRRGRHRHWDDFDWKHLNDLSFSRIRHLLGMEVSSDPEVIRELEKYGLGTARTLAEYQAFANLDFKNRLIDGKTAEQREAGLTLDQRRENARKAFGEIYRQNGWGAKETKCGWGSTLAQTEVLRRKLPDLLRFLGADIVIDAGCGDANWISQISQDFRLYLGFDLVEEAIMDMRKRHNRRLSHSFAVADITRDVLPKGDVIVCRDVLTHLPADMTLEALARFKQSGSAYLLATTFTDTANSDIRIGGWYPSNLTAAPFNLPPPRILLSEDLSGTTKSLGVWAIADLP